jgi:multisubunit Na+/H+ antiporter MnhB subunit
MKMKIAGSQISWFVKATTFICVFALTLILGWSVLALPPFSDQMVSLVSGNMGISGVENPVTAVLLNFRGYDTLLEVGVLLLAAFAVLSIFPSPVIRSKQHPSQMAAILLRWILPLTVLVGGYVLWIGSYAPGGAFQAGAILAGGGILYVIVGVRWHPLISKAIPLLMVTGLLIFILVALSTIMVTGGFLEYPTSWAGGLILLIESAATISIAIILTVLFVGRDPREIFTAQDDNDHSIDLEKENWNT